MLTGAFFVLKNYSNVVYKPTPAHRSIEIVQKSYVNRLLFVGKFTPQLVRIPNYHLFLEAGKLLHGGCYGSVFDD